LQGKYSSIFVLIALLAGLAIGFAGTTLSYRYGLLQLPGERPFQRMARLLQLTPAQRDQIRSIMRSTHEQAEAVRRNFEQQRRELFVNAYIKIHAILDPRQQRLFDSRFVPPSVRAEAENRQRGASALATATPSASPAPP
jgi:Spy/CpxP family protein refolding chaperone